MVSFRKRGDDVSRVFVTGGAGFVGGPLCRALKERGHELLLYDYLFNGRRENVPGFDLVQGDIRDAALLKSTLAGFAPDAVIHLAAIHFIPYCNAHPAEAVDVNTRGTASLLEAAKAAPPERVIAISTAAVYAPADRAHREEDAPGPIDIYGYSKLFAEGLLQLYRRETGRAAIAVRLFNVYGLADTNPHVLPDILDQVRAGKGEIELGNLAPKRDYIHADDVAAALAALLDFEAKDNYHCFNLGTGNEVSVTELVEAIARRLGKKIRIRSAPSRQRKVERPHLLADISRISGATGWRPRYDLARGIEKTLRDEGLLAAGR